MFEFLAGEPPFNDDTPIGTYRKIVAGVFEFPEGFDARAQDLISRLLTADPDKRLGCLEGGASDVLGHKFFEEIDFKKLVAKELTPPFTPDVEDDEDISNFEEPEDQDDGVDTADVTLNQADFDGW
jgi:serine/threonine protein kinase